MGEGKENKNNKLSPNGGFSLIELVISILMLIIVMLPLLNSFYQSARLNQKAKELQNQSLLATNIMEGIKSMPIDEIKNQFMGNLADFDLIKSIDSKQIIEEIKVIKSDDDSGTYEFAINGIKENGSIYDAVIIMKADNYRLSDDGILNSYPMPEAINLDIYANGIMFSDGRGVYPDIATEHSNADNDAIAAILQEGEKYARRMFEQSYEYQAAKARWENECEQARLEGKPLPPRPSTLDFNSALFPDYCNAEIVKHKISKSMNITVSNQTNNYAVSYKIIYQCNWASGESSTCQYNIMDIKFPRAVNNLYLFYIPTDFKLETINIKNKTPDHGINFFLAKQGEVGNIPEITINLDKDDNIKVYTNIDSPSLKLNDKGIYYPEKITVNIVESKQKDRIYSVEIKLYKYGATPEGKYKEELYSLISTVSKEN